MPCVARRGATPAAPVTPAITGGPMDDAPPCPPEQPKHCDAHATRCGKNPENLTDRQRAKLEWIAKTDPRLYRAYLLKEGLRTVFKLPTDQAGEALDRWVAWARRCRIESFVRLQRRIVNHRAQILASIAHGLSNGLIESVNTKIRLITRIAFGFAHPDPLIALAMLTLGGHRPTLPGRQ